MTPWDTRYHVTSLETVDIIGIVVHCVTPRDTPYKTQSVTPKGLL